MIHLKAPSWLVADDKVDKVPAGQSDPIAEALKTRQATHLKRMHRRRRTIRYIWYPQGVG